MHIQLWCKTRCKNNSTKSDRPKKKLLELNKMCRLIHTFTSEATRYLKDYMYMIIVKYIPTLWDSGTLSLYIIYEIL